MALRKGVFLAVFAVFVEGLEPPVVVNGRSVRHYNLGETVELTCEHRNSASLVWILPNNRVLLGYSDPRADGRLEQIGREVDSRVTIRIRSATYSDTGVYKCLANSSGHAASTDIAVFVADAEESKRPLLLPFGRTRVVTITSNLDSYIPCISSFGLDGTNILFYPDNWFSKADRRPARLQYQRGAGFLVPANSRLYDILMGKNKKNVMGPVSCEATDGERRAKIHFKLFLNVVGKTKSRITKSNAATAYKGGSLNIVCRTELLNRHSHTAALKIQWRGPNSARKLEAKESILKTGSGIVSKLTVPKLTQSDSGKYTCLGSHSGQMSSSDSVVVNVSRRERVELGQ